MSLSIIGTPKHTVEHGCKVVRGAFLWNSTDASGELDCGGLQVVEGASFTFVIGTAGSHDPQDAIEIQEALSDNLLHVPSTGAITLLRAASGTSAAKCLYELKGY